MGCVLHRGPTPNDLAAVLGYRSSLPVREPRQGETVQHGMIYLAPPDRHLLFQREGIEVQRSHREHSTRPAVDPLFRSAAATYGERVVLLYDVKIRGTHRNGTRCHSMLSVCDRREI